MRMTVCGRFVNFGLGGKNPSAGPVAHWMGRCCFSNRRVWGTNCSGGSTPPWSAVIVLHKYVYAHRSSSEYLYPRAPIQQHVLAFFSLSATPPWPCFWSTSHPLSPSRRSPWNWRPKNLAPSCQACNAKMGWSSQRKKWEVKGSKLSSLKTSCWCQPIWESLIKLDHVPKQGREQRILKPPPSKSFKV